MSARHAFLELRGVLLKPFCTGAPHSLTTKSSKDDGNHLWRYATLHRLAQNGLLYPALLEPECLLSRPLLFLLPSLLLGFGDQPVTH